MNQYLLPVNESQRFKLANGVLIQSLEELKDSIVKMDDGLFHYHVNPEKNDFANWIKYCIKFDLLYEKLNLVVDRTKFLQILSSQIDELKMQTPELKQATSESSKNDTISDSKSTAEIESFFKAPEPMNLQNSDTFQKPTVQQVVQSTQSDIQSNPQPVIQPNIQPVVQSSNQNSNQSELKNDSKSNASMDAVGFVDAEITFEFEQIFGPLMIEIYNELFLE